jgi:hypothetical protein
VPWFQINLSPPFDRWHLFNSPRVVVDRVLARFQPDFRITVEKGELHMCVEDLLALPDRSYAYPVLPLFNDRNIRHRGTDEVVRHDRPQLRRATGDQYKTVEGEGTTRRFHTALLQASKVPESALLHMSVKDASKTSPRVTKPEKIGARCRAITALDSDRVWEGFSGSAPAARHEWKPLWVLIAGQCLRPADLTHSPTSASNGVAGIARTRRIGGRRETRENIDASAATFRHSHDVRGSDTGRL